jgi:serine/threonine protein kinase
MSYQSKYQKYKQKYFNLKNIIGGGINATYILNGINLTVKYELSGKMNEIQYKLIETLGEGGNGIAHLIQKIGDTKNLYVFKRGKHIGSFTSYEEGIASDQLKGILDEDMLVLFQGKSPSDFLITTYNGKDLQKEYEGNKEKIKNEFVDTTTQILNLLYKINQKRLFHNDIKLENITIKNKKIYLIDFGMLKNSSQTGSLINMSFKSAITFCESRGWNKYASYHQKLKSFLPDTDIVGFFFCCLDLFSIGLPLKQYLSFNMLIEFGITKYEADHIYKLVNLYYFILPSTKRDIPELDRNSNDYNYKFPNSENAKIIFGDISKDNENLFRFMAFIYNKLKYIPSIYNLNELHFKEFLKVISDCLLPNFNYVNFKPKFEKSVNLLFPKLYESVKLPQAIIPQAIKPQAIKLPEIFEVSKPVINEPNSQIMYHLKEICKQIK